MQKEFSLKIQIIYTYIETTAANNNAHEHQPQIHRFSAPVELALILSSAAARHSSLDRVFQRNCEMVR